MVEQFLLTDAARVAPFVSADRLRLAREFRGWTQRELVAQISANGQSLTSAAVSQLELGRSTPSARTLLRIAEATRFPLDYFVRRNEDAEAEGFFRSLRATAVRERRRAIAQAHLVHDFVRVMEHYVELPDLDVPRITVEPADQDGLEHAAFVLRRKWSLGDGPIRHVVRELEQHGVVTTRLSLGRQELDAFSVWFDDRPIVVLGADKESTARSRFDAAHELGHGVLHHETDIGSTQAESDAHRFAAAFLMPRSSIAPYLSPSVNWRQMMDVKAMWGVSLGALLIRARDLEILSPQRYVNAMKYMSSRGWRRSEPGDRVLGSPEEPRLLREALRDAATNGHELTDIAGEGGLPAEDVRALVVQKCVRRG